MGFAEDLKRLLEESAIPAESEAGRRLTSYFNLLEKWNRRLNLTSATEWRVVGPMLREAIWAAQFYPVEGEFHLDIGSGAGFPALLLKVLVPRIALDMVESREKKCRFLETAAVRLGMEGIRIHHALLSDYLRTHGCGKSWDCISWKGLKMGTRDLRQLRAHAHTGTQVWMFHGRSPATEETDSINKEFELVRKEAVPGTRDSHLSIYRPR